MSILYYFSFFVLFSIAFQFSQNNLPDTHNPLLLIYAPTRDTIFSILSGIFSFFKRFTSSSSEIFASLQDVVNAFIRFFKFIFGDVFYLIQSTFQLIKAIIMLPIDFILDFTASFDRLMSLFSKFLKTLLLTLYSLSKKILTPIWNISKSFLRYPIKIIIKLMKHMKIFLHISLNHFRNVTFSSFRLLKVIVKSISKISFKALFDSIDSAIMYVYNFIQRIINKIPFMELIQSLISLVFRAPYHFLKIIFSSLKNVIMTIYLYTKKLLNIIAITFYDFCIGLIDYLKLFLNVPALFEKAYNLFKYGFSNIINFILYYPLRLIIYLGKLIRKPFIFIINNFIYLSKAIYNNILIFARFFDFRKLIYLFDNIKYGILRLFDSFYNIVNKIKIKNFIVGPFNLILKILSNIQYLKNLPQFIYKTLLMILHSLVMFIQTIFNGLINFIIKPFVIFFQYILLLLNRLSNIPIAGYIITLIRFVLYVPLWIFSFMLRTIYYFIFSIINLFSNDIEFKNVSDMWVNACWPKDSEYCRNQTQNQI